MANKILRCSICGEFFHSKRELKRHKDKSHRIAGSKVLVLKKKKRRNNLTTSTKNRTSIQ